MLLKIIDKRISLYLYFIMMFLLKLYPYAFFLLQILTNKKNIVIRYICKILKFFILSVRLLFGRIVFRQNYNFDNFFDLNGNNFFDYENNFADNLHNFFNSELKNEFMQFDVSINYVEYLIMINIYQKNYFLMDLRLIFLMVI